LEDIEEAKGDLNTLKRQYANVVGIITTWATEHKPEMKDVEGLQQARAQLNRSKCRPAEHHGTSMLPSFPESCRSFSQERLLLP
jgi:hypothetical protein